MSSATVGPHDWHTDDPSLEGWARLLFDRIDDAIFVHDLKGNILVANPAACQRLGYSREELLRLNTRDIDDPGFAAAFTDRLHNQLEQGAFRCEGKHRTKDGRTIHVDINTSSIDFRGQPAVLAVMRDITERKRGEEAARKQTLLLQSILDCMGDGVLVVDSAGKLLVTNPVAEAMFGACLPALCFLPVTPGCAICLPDGRTPFPPEQLPLARVLRGEVVDDLELFVRHSLAPEGVYVSMTGRPLHDPAGHVKAAVLVCHDVSDRKRSEQRRVAQYGVTRMLAESTSLEECAPRMLQVLGESFGWDIAALWIIDDNGQSMRCVEAWSGPKGNAQEFLAKTRAGTFKRGEGLPGRVWQSGGALWEANFASDSNYPRAPLAAREGLLSGFAFPLRSGAQMVGVIEFFLRGRDKPRDALLAFLASLGSQIGQVLERHRVTVALRRSEALYQSLVESLPQNIFRKDREGRVTFCNRRYCEALKRPLEELLGKTDFDLFPEDLARKYREDDRWVMETGRMFETLEGHRLPSGEMTYVHVMKIPLRDHEGSIIGTQGVFWDETAKKRAQEALQQSERRYRQLTEATIDGIVLADHDGKILLFNAAAERIFGYQADEVLGQPLRVLVPDRYLSQHDEGFARFLRTREPHIVGRTVEVEGRRKDGTVFPLEIALSALEVGGLPGPDGKPVVQFLGAIRDLTERNRIRSRLMQNEKLASIGLLSAGVAHEINNPLAFVGNNFVVLDRDVKGLLQLIELLTKDRDVSGAEHKQQAEDLAEEIDLDYIRANLPRLLTRTREGIDRVSRIVHSLRGLARTDRPQWQEANLPELIENSLEIIRGRLREQNIEIVKDFDPDTSLRCVDTQISQVTLNLFINALQAMEARTDSPGGRLTVRTRRLSEEMLLEISDTGIGIDPIHLPRLFDPFFTTKDVGEGTGLGLSISHNIVTGHGGRIEVHSQPNAGTTFRVYLPLHSPKDRG